MKIWLNYPLAKAIVFLDTLRAHGYSFEERAHVLEVGPLAFMVVWRKRIQPAQEGGSV